MNTTIPNGTTKGTNNQQENIELPRLIGLAFMLESSAPSPESAMYLRQYWGDLFSNWAPHFCETKEFLATFDPGIS